MMVPSHFYLNVARDTGRKDFHGDTAYAHFCRIELGQVLEGDAKAMAADIRPRFPAPEFKLELTHVRCSGFTVAF